MAPDKNMKTTHPFPTLLILLLAGLLTITPGCDSGGGGGPSVPDADTPDADADDGGEEESVVSETPDCLAVGDGLTKGVGVDYGKSWPQLLEDRLDAPVAVDARGGASVADVAGRLQELLEFDPASHVLVLVGTNDIAEQNPIDEMRASYQSIINIARANGATPILATLPALYGYGNEAVAHLLDINAMIRSVAGANGVRVARLDVEFGTDQTLILDDGVHPSPTGHVIIMAAFYDLL